MLSESVNSILARQQLNEQEAAGASQNIDQRFTILWFEPATESVQQNNHRLAIGRSSSSDAVEAF